MTTSITKKNLNQFFTSNELYSWIQKYYLENNLFVKQNDKQIK